jgi:hypothetical protein
MRIFAGTFVNDFEPKMYGKSDQVPQLTSELLDFLKEAPTARYSKKMYKKSKRTHLKL